MLVLIPEFETYTLAKHCSPPAAGQDGSLQTVGWSDTQDCLAIRAGHQSKGKTLMHWHICKRGITCQRESTKTATMARLAAVRTKFRAEHIGVLLLSRPLYLNIIFRSFPAFRLLWQC
jgi:hypothetical protein